MGEAGGGFSRCAGIALGATGHGRYTAGDRRRMRVSQTDSFLSEVAEEVRRDRLYSFFRRFGWAIAGAVLLIVGGAAWHAWSLAREQAAARAAGDALREALALPDPAARAEALAALPEGRSTPVARMAAAGALAEAGDLQAAAARLDEIAADGAAPRLYRAAAALERVMALGDELDPSERRATLDTLAGEGEPFRLLALEQRALFHAEAGDTAAAVADLQTIVDAPEAPQGLRGRAQQLVVALGGAEATPASDGAPGQTPDSQTPETPPAETESPAALPATGSGG